MNRKDYVRILRKFLAVIIIFSMLQGHVGVLGSFTHVAYAAIESSIEEYFDEKSEQVIQDENIQEDDEEFELNQSLSTEKSENTVNETVSNQEETIMENVVPEEVVEEKTEDAEETEEVVEETDAAEEEYVEESEILNSEVKIVDSFRYLDGVVVRAEFNNSLINLKHVVESLKFELIKPKVEGYTLEKVYIEDMELASDDSIHNVYETPGSIAIDVSGEDAVVECNHKYTFVFVFKGTGEFTNLTFDMNAHLVYKDLVEEEYTSVISSEIETEDESDKEISSEIVEDENLNEVEEESIEIAEATDSESITLENVGGELNVFVHTYTEEELAKFVKELDFSLTEKVDVEVKSKVLNEYVTSTQNSSIYKGYLYANAISEAINETVYTSVYNVKVKSLDNIDKIVVKENTNEIISKDNSRVNLGSKSEFAKISVNTEKFISVFGLYGSIDVVSNGDVIGKITSNSLVENNAYTFYYPENISNVEFVFKGMEATGEIEIVNTKVIKEDAGFTREEVIGFDKINTEINVTEFAKIDDEEIRLYQENKNLEVNLEDTESRMEIFVSTDSLSTSSPNDVTFTVTLKTDEERYELFKNPYFEIRLPSDVSDVKINTINLLYKNGLTIDRYDVVTDEFGNKAIRVNLLGTQREYTPGLPSTGSTITIYTTITLDRLTTNQESKYEFRYDNQVKSNLSYEVEGKECEDIIVRFVSKQGLLRALSLTNVGTSDSVISYDNESSELLVKEHAETQIINYKGTIVNNFNTELTNVVVVGKIPTMGAVDGNLNRLETTFDMTLNSPIATNGLIAKVYYSENVNAEKDDLSWVEDVTDLSKYKAFKIVIENETVKQGESLNFSLNMNVPSGLDYNNKAYATYTVYYCLNGQELTGTSTDKVLTEEKEMTIDDFSDEEIDEVATLNFITVASQGGTTLTEQDTVFERQIVDYTVFVKNTSNVPVTNVKIKADVHNANLYYKYIFESDEYDLENMVTYFYYKEDTDNSKQFEEFIIDSLAPGETASFTYQCIADEIADDGEKEIYSSIKVSADDIEETSIETLKTKVKNTKVSLKLEWAFRQIVDEKDVFAGDGLKYRIYYKNISTETLKNQVVYFTVPNTVRYTGEIIEGAEDFKIEEIETSEGVTLAITVPEIKAGEELNFYITLISNEFDIEKQSIDMCYLAYTYIGEEQIKSNKYVQPCYQDKTKIKYTFVADKEENVMLKDGDEVTFTLTMENIGSILSDYNEFSTELPKGLKLEKVYLTKKGERNEIEITKDSRITITEDNFDKNDIFKLELVTKFYKDYLSYDQKIVEVQMTVDGGVAYDKFYTNVISFDVENDKVTADEEEVIEDENGNEITGENGGTPPPPVPEEPTEDKEENNEQNNEQTDDKKDESKEENKNEQTNNENEEVNNNNSSNNNENNNNNNGNNYNNVNNNSNQENKPNTENNETLNNGSNGSSNSNTQQNQPTVTTKKTYRINGKAWLDKNKDGKYETGEEILPNIKVTAYQVDNNKGKVEDGKVKGTTKTSTDGTYVFAGLENGHYILVFEYDTEMYSPTKYEAKNVPTSANSDVIAKEMAKTRAKVAMTDTLEIKDNTLTNIDIGLVLNNEFDLKVSKFVEKAIVNNSKGNKETKFDKDELVKLEIHSKMFESSKVKVVYKIVVENNGDVDAFVNEITDIMPKGTTFNAEENKGWHQNNDGKLVYTGLIGKTIKAGERKEVTLILNSGDNTVATKQLENNVELTGISNEKGQDDIDLKNNKAKVTLLIIPSTGKVINNTLIVICVITIIAIVVIVILNKDKFKRNYK